MKVIKETTLHPDGNEGVDLYPKTNINQVEGLSEKLEVYDNYQERIINLETGKLAKPSTPSVESAVTMLADGTVLTKTFNDIVSPVVDKPYELIEEITITEDMAYTQSNRDVVISRASEPDGTPYNFKKLFVQSYYGNIQSVDIDTTLDYGGNIYAGNAGQNNIGLYCRHNIGTNSFKSCGDYYNYWVENGRSNARGEYWANEALSRPASLINNTLLSPLDKITKLTFYAQLPKGTIVYIYGVRA